MNIPIVKTRLLISYLWRLASISYYEWKGTLSQLQNTRISIWKVKYFVAARAKCWCTCKFSEVCATHFEVREEFIALHLMNSHRTTLTHLSSTGRLESMVLGRYDWNPRYITLSDVRVWRILQGKLSLDANFNWDNHEKSQGTSCFVWKLITM
jgi:hypothetical protein